MSSSGEAGKGDISYPDAVAKGMMISASSLAVEKPNDVGAFEGEFRPPPGPREVRCGVGREGRRE